MSGLGLNLGLLLSTTALGSGTVTPPAMKFNVVSNSMYVPILRNF